MYECTLILLVTDIQIFSYLRLRCCQKSLRGSQHKVLFEPNSIADCVATIFRPRQLSRYLPLQVPSPSSPLFWSLQYTPTSLFSLRSFFVQPVSLISYHRSNHILQVTVTSCSTNANGFWEYRVIFIIIWISVHNFSFQVKFFGDLLVLKTGCCLSISWQYRRGYNSDCDVVIIQLWHAYFLSKL